MTEQTGRWQAGHKILAEPDQYEATHARFTETLARAERVGDHLWTAIVTYFVTDPTKPELILDQENLALLPMVGCYRCEEPYSKRTLQRRCPGKPS